MASRECYTFEDFEVQEARVWTWEMYVNEQKALNDLFSYVCETCVQEVNECDAQVAVKWKIRPWVLSVWQLQTTRGKPSIELKQYMLIKYDLN